MENKAKLLNQQLKEVEEVKMYLSLKEKLSKDEYVNNLIDNIQSIQKDMKEYIKNNDLNNYKLKQKELELLKEKFYAHPLIINYLNCKEDVYRLIEQIAWILSEK